MAGANRSGPFALDVLLPLGAVWDYYCLTRDVPVGLSWLADVTAYEKNALLKRG